MLLGLDRAAERLIDRDHAHVVEHGLTDRLVRHGRERAVEILREDHVHAVARGDQTGHALGGTHRDGDRAHGGRQHGCQEAALIGLHQIALDQWLADGETAPRDRADEILLRHLPAHHGVGRRSLVRGELLPAHVGQGEQGARGYRPVGDQNARTRGARLFLLRLLGGLLGTRSAQPEHPQGDARNHREHAEAE